MAYNQPGEEDDADIRLDYDHFTAFIEASSVPYLKMRSLTITRSFGEIDVSSTQFQNATGRRRCRIEERINYVLQAEINPNLAAHGGNVQLLELVDDEAGLTQCLSLVVVVKAARRWT